jgi:hypothetical protein
VDRRREAVVSGEETTAQTPVEVDHQAGALAPPLPAPVPVQRIQLGKYSVPLPWVLSWARRDCRNCNGRGTVLFLGQAATAEIEIEVLPEKRGKRVLCGCAQRAAEARLAAYARTEAKPVEPPPAARDEREEARAARRREALQREVAKLEGELAGREQALERKLDADRVEASRWAIAEQDAATDVGLVSDAITKLHERIREMEWSLSSLRQTLATREQQLVEVKNRRDEAPGKRKEAEERIARARDRFERDTVGLRKEIAKAQRRLAAAMREVPGEAGPRETEAA